MTASARASSIVAAAVDTVFATLTDIGRLPERNDVRTSVIERPERLEVGAQWLVEFHALGQTCRSRSVVAALDVQPADR